MHILSMTNKRKKWKRKGKTGKKKGKNCVYINISFHIYNSFSQQTGGLSSRWGSLSGFTTTSN